MCHQVDLLIPRSPSVPRCRAPPSASRGTSRRPVDPRLGTEVVAPERRLARLRSEPFPGFEVGSLWLWRQPGLRCGLRGRCRGGIDRACASRSARESAPAMRTSSRLTSSGSMAPPRPGSVGREVERLKSARLEPGRCCGAGRLVGGDAAHESVSATTSRARPAARRIGRRRAGRLSMREGSRRELARSLALVWRVWDGPPGSVVGRRGTRAKDARGSPLPCGAGASVWCGPGTTATGRWGPRDPDPVQQRIAPTTPGAPRREPRWCQGATGLGCGVRSLSTPVGMPPYRRPTPGGA